MTVRHFSPVAGCLREKCQGSASELRHPELAQVCSGVVLETFEHRLFTRHTKKMCQTQDLLCVISN